MKVHPSHPAERQLALSSSFRWKRDVAGYKLSEDRKRIERRYGQLLDYDPIKIEPPLHYIFSHLDRHVPYDDHQVRPTVPNNAPIYLRQFDDGAAAFLAFVNEFGFLGGADLDSELVDELQREQKRLSGFFDFGFDPVDGIKPFDFEGPLVQIRVASERGTKSPRLKLEPKNLRDWLWYCVALDLVNGIDWNAPSCEYCNKPMPRGRGGHAHRSHARFCSSRCRTYFNRLPPAKRSKDNEDWGPAWSIERKQPKEA
jgi:hypothetical protein